jgi:hypothetical protein
VSGSAAFDFLSLSSLDQAAALLADPAGDVGDLTRQPDAAPLAAMREPEGLDAELGIGLSRIDQPPAGLTSTGPSLAQTLGWAVDRKARVSTPTGRDLQAFLQDGIVGISHLMDDDPLIEPAHTNGAASEPDAPVAPVAPGAPVAPADAEIVSIDALLYRGPAALERARVVRDALRADGASPESLAELYDLLDLASTS